MPKNSRTNLAEVRQTRNQAEMLCNQLRAEYERLQKEKGQLPQSLKQNPRREEALDLIRKAIKATNLAVECIDQALREMGWVDDQEQPS